MSGLSWIPLALSTGGEGPAALVLLLLVLVVFMLVSGDDDLPGPRLCHAAVRGGGMPGIPGF